MSMSECSPTEMNTFGHSISPFKNKLYSNEMPMSDCSQTVDEYVWAFHLTIKNQIIFK